MKANAFGVRNRARKRGAHHVHRQNAAAVLEQVHDRPPFRRRKPISVMVGGVVVSDGGVEAAGGRGEIAARLVGELIALEVDAELVGCVRTEY